MSRSSVRARRLVAPFLIASQLAVPVLAQEVPGRLQRVGGLSCVVSAGEREGVSRLACELRLFHAATDIRRYQGELTGSGLALVDPGSINVIWSVLAPVYELDPTGLIGSYDTTSLHGFVYAGQSSQLLVGGVNDSVGLELQAPAVNAVRPETRMTLHLVRA